MSKQSVIQAISTHLIACNNSRKSNNMEWVDRHREIILKLISDHMPSGSGFDNGTQFDFIRSTSDKIVFTTSFHHMNESGMYDGWTEHTVTVRPSFVYQVDLTITGINRNDIKDYIHDVFRQALLTEIKSDE